jgi:hypothetical protein
VKVDYAFVAEAADSQGGLFYVTRGGADIYLLPKEFPKPLRLGAISFVLRVVGDPDDIGRTRKFVCRIVGSNGEPSSFEQEVNAVFERHPVDPDRANGSVLAFRFYGFPVPDFGTYHLEVSHGGETLATVPFWVVPAEDAPPGLAGTVGEQAELPSTGYL